MKPVTPPPEHQYDFKLFHFLLVSLGGGGNNVADERLVSRKKIKKEHSFLNSIFS